jgi:hypothetical protein
MSTPTDLGSSRRERVIAEAKRVMAEARHLLELQARDREIAAVSRPRPDLRLIDGGRECDHG